MTQLSYQPAFDPYHAVYRAFRLRDTTWALQPIETEKYRMLDFYLLFPFLLAEIRLKQNHRWIRTMSRKYADKRPYAKLPDGSSLLRRMKPFQTAALQSLSKAHYCESEELTDGFLIATPKPTPTEILDRVIDANDEDSELLRALSVIAQDYNLLGEDGLKSRSGLMEYRYDAV